MGPVTRLLAAAKVAGLFAVRRPKDAAIILLALLLGTMCWRIDRERGHAQELASKMQGLPPNTKQVVTVYRDRIRVVTRDGPLKVEYRDRYLPPEGKVEIVTRIDQPEKPPEVVAKDRGLTARLGGGVIHAGEVLPLVDLKIGYWRRYSATIGITPEFCGMGVSRHVDDFAPFGNLEILSMAGPDWSGNPRFGFGLRMNF